MNFVTLVEV